MGAFADSSSFVSFGETGRLNEGGCEWGATGVGVKKGVWAEGRVCDLLIQQGWHIAYRNFRCLGGELDIVGFESATQLVVVEVKCGRNSGIGSRVNQRKAHRLVLAVGQLLAQHPEWDGYDVRIDVAMVLPNEVVWLRDIRLLDFLEGAG